MDSSPTDNAVSLADHQQENAGTIAHAHPIDPGGGEELIELKQAEHKPTANRKPPEETSSGPTSGPWKVVQKQIGKLSEQLDINLIRTDLWSTGLISFREYSRYGLRVEAGPELVAELLMSLVNLNQAQDFYTFLTVLQKTGRYQKLANDLRKEAGEVESDDKGGSHIHPFILVRRCRNQLWDISVQEDIVHQVTNWRRAEPENKSPSDREGNTRGDLNIESGTVYRGENLLQEFVSLPRDCKGHGDIRVVVLAGETREIAAWLHENEVATEEELGKLVNQKSETVSSDMSHSEGHDTVKVSMESTSGIYCFLPEAGNTIYCIVCLRLVDEPEVHTSLLRIAVEMSPMWLIFHSKRGIEANSFCKNANVEPELKSSPSLIAKLRDVYRIFPSDYSRRCAMEILHIQFVFNVKAAFFSDSMVFQSEGREDLDARCEVKTRRLFNDEPESSCRTPASTQSQQEMPELSIGISLRNRLRPASVSGFKVDLSWWLRMIVGFVPVPMLSCSAFPSGKTRVTSKVFPPPRLPFTRKSSTMDSGHSPDSNRKNVECTPCADIYGHLQSSKKAAAELIGNAMDNQIKLPVPLRHILTAWRGPVQVIACFGAKKGEALHFANHLFGGGLRLLTHGESSLQTACLETENQECGDSARSLMMSSAVEEAMKAQTGAKTSGFPLVMKDGVCGLGPHTHPEDCQLWVSCYPSDAMLYVVLTCDQLPLTGAHCSSGSHQSAALVVAAALSNVFVVLTSEFDEDTDVMHVLLRGLRRYGNLMPSRKNRDVQLFNSVLLPVVPYKNANHKCSGSHGAKCCSSHFKRICQDKTLKTCFEEELQHFVSAVEPVSCKNPTGMVRDIMDECIRNYESGNAFQHMLRLILATMVTNGLEAQPPLEVLKLEHILEKPWLDFRSSLLKALSHGEAGERHLLSDTKEVRITLTSRNGKPFELAWPVAKTVLGLMTGEETDNKEAEKRLPYLNQSQRDSIHDVRVRISELYCQGEKASFKHVPPRYLVKILQDVFQALAQQRSHSCKNWLNANIANQPFAGPEAKQRCINLIDKLLAQWNFCGHRCEEGEGCHYSCLLPMRHSSAIPHSCLDVKETRAHRCEDMCKFCCLEHDVKHPTKRRRALNDIRPCSKPAGHQHVKDSEAQLHVCGDEHKCEKECTLKEARGCKTDPKDPQSGNCVKRMDHHDLWGEDAQLCLCSVPEEGHLCPKPCELKQTYGGCTKDEYCSKYYRDRHTRHLCGNVHKCLQECKNDGVCLLSDLATLHEAEKLERGVNGFRRKCHHTVQPDSIDHTAEGLCDCGAEHTCDTVCPFCKRFCTKPFGHTGCKGDDALCQVDHGQILASSWMEVILEVTNTVMEVDGLTCVQICSKAGRGHSHRRLQANLRPCQSGTEGQQGDKVKHSTFWQLLRFTDPHPQHDKDVFDRCPYPCPRRSEHKVDVFCQDWLWHEAYMSIPKNRHGFVGRGRDGGDVQGHFFPCTDHFCLQNCSVLQKREPCSSQCKLALGHAEGGCDCQSGKHVCGKPCTMKALCGKACEQLVEHKGHECCCDESSCPQPCYFGCKGKKCVQKKHIHRLKEGEIHHCGKEHKCNNGCQAKGICYVSDSKTSKQPEPAPEDICSRHPDGAVQLKCCQRIAAGNSQHKGEHHCQHKHTCDAKCPFCGCYCTRQFDHSGDHMTDHGPVKNIQQLTIRRSTGDNVHFDKDEEIICSQICKGAGIGHEHSVGCSADHSKEGRRHDTANKDWVRHDLFWEATGFSDPSPSDMISNMSRCPIACPHPSHESHGSEAYCSGKLGHKVFTTADRKGSLKGKGGYIGHYRDKKIEGHHFRCDSHACGEMNHKCKMLSKSWQKSCEGICSLPMGHDDSCNCNSGKHVCGHKCAGQDCNGSCIKYMENPHSSTECSCEETACMVKCEICKEEPCHKTTEHLHQVSDETSSVHHCGRKHLCHSWCEERGVCAIVPPGQEPSGGRIFRRTPEGIDGIQLSCCIDRAVGAIDHKDKHTCGRQHTCNKVCSLCKHYCTQVLDHPGKCKTKHGTAKHLRFLNFKKSGEATVLHLNLEVPCDQLCSLAGRAHKHIISSIGASKYSADRRGNQTKQEQKEVFHGVFWKTVNPFFGDPTAEENEEVSVYDRCSALCERCSEENKQAYCTGLAGHKTFTTLAAGVEGYISLSRETEGHHFPCTQHLCLLQCSILSTWTRLWTRCPGECQQKLGHPDTGKKCKCNATAHFCGNDCSAAPLCKNKCTVDVSSTNKHKCQCDEKQCKVQCQYEGCTQACSRGHVHSLNGNASEMIHYCGADHPCSQFCDVEFMKGLCPHDTSVEGMKRVSGTANGYRGRCSLPVTVGRKSHAGKCKCKFPQEEHTCLSACPLCAHVCTLQYNHIARSRSKHKTDHGIVAADMSLKIYLPSGQPVELKNQRCGEMCLAAGRGHTHTQASKVPLPEDEDDWKIVDGERRLLHTRFWAHYNFQDPLPGISASLNGCPVMCGREHESAKLVHCTGRRWHGNFQAADSGYLLQDYDQSFQTIHHFPCTGHECREKCQLRDNRKRCERLCRKALGHKHMSADRCNCQQSHICGEVCSARKCSHSCQLEIDHTGEHSCKAKSPCPSNCSHCGKPCYSELHVHEIRSGDKIHHHCDQDHVCNESNFWGSNKPLCKVAEEANCQEVEAHPDTSNPLRLLCMRKIQAGQQSHSGAHCHSNDFEQDAKNVTHYCNARCLMCGNCCMLPVDHPGLHDTKHGQVQYDSSDHWMVLPGNASDKVRDATQQRMNAKGSQKLTCFNICKNAGRGHFHTHHCTKAAGECQEVVGHIRHDNQSNVDLVSHSAFWLRKNQFIDRSDEADKKTFAKCGRSCPQTDHKNQGSTVHKAVGLCVGEVLHPDIAFDPAEDHRYYKNGHAFNCKHNCSKNCMFHATSRNCKERCSKRLDHEDPACSCGLTEHLCNSFCQVSTINTGLCDKKCIMSCEEHHKLTPHSLQWYHVCARKECNQECRVERCENGCSLGHLHVLEKANREHACKQHPIRTCNSDCKAKGICRILLADDPADLAQLAESKVTKPQKGWRGPCETNHNVRGISDRPHMCKLTEMQHHCPKSCPMCGFHCRLGPVHDGDHTTVHGMLPAGLVETVLTASLECVKLKESTSCRAVCKLAGRGHFHKAGCQTQASVCQFAPEQHKHHEDGVDLQTHSWFWKSALFDDPCQSSGPNLSKCGEKCHGDEYQPTAVYCDLECLHAPAGSSTGIAAQSWQRGHLFKNCPHLCAEQCQRCMQKGQVSKCQLVKSHVPELHSCLQDPAPDDDCWACCPMCKNVCFNIGHSEAYVHQCLHGKISENTSKCLLIFDYIPRAVAKMKLRASYDLIEPSVIEGMSCGDVCTVLHKYHRHVLQECTEGNSTACLKRQRAYSCVTHDVPGYDSVSHDDYWRLYGFTAPNSGTGAGD